MQVRQAKLGLRASTYQQLLAERANLNMTISANGDLADIVQRGLSDQFKTLATDERQRFHSVQIQAFLLFNSVYRLYEGGVIDDEDWCVDEGFLKAWKSSPQFASWWAIQKHLFRPAFVRMVDDLVIERGADIDNLVLWMGAQGMGAQGIGAQD